MNKQIYLYFMWIVLFRNIIPIERASTLGQIDSELCLGVVGFLFDGPRGVLTYHENIRLRY